MVEGWAVYTERMMLEQGYGDHAPEMWLMYYNWHLRSVCNTILDYEVHVNGWNEKVALHFLMRDAFQGEAEAAGKWRRVKLSQVQPDAATGPITSPGAEGIYKGRSPLFDNGGYTRGSPLVRTKAFRAVTTPRSN